MARVHILFDPHHLRTSSAGIQVNSPSDYVSACVQISKALHEHDVPLLEVQVYDATAGEWLKGWAGQYDDQQVQIKTYRAYDVLKERWNMEIPALDDNDIIRSGLLDENISVRSGQSFEDVVLEHYYHSFFTYAAFPERQLAGYLNQAGKVDWKKNANRPIVTRIFRERLDQWESRENNKDRRSIISQLKRDWQNLRLSLGVFKLVKGYPQVIGDKMLGEQYMTLRRAQIDTEDLLLEGLDLQETVVQIEYYLSATKEKIQNAEELITLLNQLSGCIVQEFHFVEDFLKQHAEWITPDLIRHVERRFAPIRRGVMSRLTRLRRLLAVPRPSAPVPTWNVTEWLDWIANAYMPYHRWLEAHNKYDEEVAGYAATFSDWYYQNFIELKNSSPESFTFSNLYNDRTEFIDNDRVVLVIVLDNLNYGFFPELRRLFNQNGITLVSERPVLSLIPTATEIGKAAIMAVTGDLTDLSTVNYPTLISKTWDGILKPHGKSALYLENVGEFQNLIVLNEKIYFLNYLPVDKILHGSAQTYGQEHERRVQEVLKVLIDSILEFTKRFALEKRLMIYVVSDHGSTKITKDTVNVLDKKYFKNISDLQHHRYVAISDKQLAGIPQVVESQCYVIDRKKFKTFENYLIARRYYRFANTDQDFYVHGGLTPEEVVVPFARFEFMSVDVLPPTAHLPKQDFRYAVKSTVRFEIGNPNAFPLENISLRLPGLEASEEFIETLKPKTSAKVSFQTIFKREPGSGTTREIILYVQYESQGRSFEPVEMSFTINMKTMMETNDDFNF